MVVNNQYWRLIGRCYLLLLLSTALGCFQLTPITSYSVDYGDKRFEGGVKRDRTTKFYEFASGGATDEPLADVFLRLSDESVVPLKKLSEEDAKTWASRFEGGRVTEIEGGRDKPYTMYWVDEASMLAFRDGELIWCLLAPKPNSASPFKDVGIGPTKEGPFLPLPVNQEDITRVFGKHGPIKKNRSPQPH